MGYFEREKAQATKEANDIC